MFKYDEDTVINYINGLDIKGYSLDELEDDYLFMMQVINYTNDIKMCNFCSAKVLNNYEFVKNLIRKFGPKKVDSIITQYLKEEQDKVKMLDICALMYFLTPNNKGLNKKYKNILDANYLISRLDFEVAKEVENDDIDLENEFGKGFLLLQDSYGSSQNAIKYFATKCLNEIIIYYDIDLEEEVHSRFKTKEEINNYGVNTFLLDIIRRYDKYLAAYIASHLFMLKEFENKLDVVINDFDKYQDKLKSRKFKRILNLSYEYLDKKELSTGSSSILYYIANELGIANDLFNYEKSIYDQDIFEGVDVDSIISNIDINEFGFNEKVSYMVIKKYIIEVLNSNKPEKVQLNELKDEYLISPKVIVKKFNV